MAMRSDEITILDGPLGTRLLELGVPTPLPAWSAGAVDAASEVVARIHREYVEAGASVHTANTFRAKRRTLGDDWLRVATRAVELARAAVPAGHRVAGSIAPLEDCYRPDLSPGALSRREHRELARALASAGADILLCETFPCEIEALVAVEEAAATGTTTWLALTPGPGADLMTPESLRRAAERGIDAGASAALVNCAPAFKTLRYVEALAGLPAPIGAYANAGAAEEKMGWAPPGAHPDAPRAYAELARAWVNAGARIVGSCCGTGPAHIAALAAEFGGDKNA